MNHQKTYVLCTDQIKHKLKENDTAKKISAKIMFIDENQVANTTNAYNLTPHSLYNVVHIFKKSLKFL